MSQRYRCTGSNGAVVREGCEMDSEVVGELDSMEEVVGVESRVASNGLERIRIEGETPGWVSLRLLEPADGAAGAKDRTLVVEWREAKVVLKKITLDTDRGATCGDVKRSLFAMTRVAVARQRLSLESSREPPERDPEPLDDDAAAPTGRTKGRRVVMREAKPQKLPAGLDGSGLGAFLQSNSAVTPSGGLKPKVEDPAPAHLRSTGTLCGGSFTTRKRTPYYAKKMRNRGFDPDEETPKPAAPAAPAPRAAAAPGTARTDDAGTFTACPDDSDSSSSDEEAGDEPVVEVVSSDANRGRRGGTRKPRARRRRVLVVFDGDRLSRRLPHKVRYTFPRAAAPRDAVAAPDLVAAFAERYASLPGTAPLDAAHVVDRFGTVVGADDELLLYCDAPLKVKLGAAPAKPEAPVLATWGYTCATPAPAPFRFFARKRVEAVACGWLHCVATTESGVAFAWGNNGFGQLGTGDEKPRKLPTRVALPSGDGGPRLLKLACGAHFSLGIDASKKLWSWGRYQASNWPLKFAETWASRAASDAADVGLPPRGDVLAISAGDAHAAALVSCREAAVDVGPRVVVTACYAWGYDDRLQLGVDGAKAEGQRKPRRVASLDALPGTLKDVACGGSHTAVLTSKGEVYCWGDNACGQGGKLNRAPFREPHLLEVPEAAKLRCGRHATLCVGRDGGAYLLGALNTGGSDSATPTSFDVAVADGAAPPPPPAGARDTLATFERTLATAAPEFVAGDVADAAISEAHCLLLKNDGRLAGFGYNAYGQATGALNRDVVKEPKAVDAGAVHVAGVTAVTALAACGGTSAVVVRKAAA